MNTASSVPWLPDLVIVVFLVFLGYLVLVTLDAVLEPQKVKALPDPQSISTLCDLRMNCLECHPMPGKVY